ncbi:MAG: type I methionyl aminopeptidase [Oscillospiraceae bacterium]|nr:type I methionyl aminopeptidase [Oscillospiraceae bacterium]
MINIKSQREIEVMRKACKIAAEALKIAGEMIIPGISTKKIETQMRKYIESRGAVPSFFNYNGFPANACISINDEVIHGIPRESRIMREGDIVKIDVGAKFNGYHGDCANTFYCGNFNNINAKIKKLIETAKQSFFEGIKFACVGYRIGDVGAAIQNYVESNGFSIVREYIGHGVGRNLHEKPDIPHYVEEGKGKGQRLAENMVIAIEPMVNMGSYEVKVHEDKWTVKTLDGSLSAHYENTVLIKKNGCEILTVTDASANYK